ncbi:hypothetical protein B0J11DRAFT_26463 [Dendryphion nanum]|uniref:Uncharacterized protein n=1 Tax=Dendryphion nanum TaxID=256645 RepID=A0A9P9EJY2_9PLEO|nr:hypothetical protein B0J11DRAFT_26463 [Dendryphion nanum]
MDGIAAYLREQCVGCWQCSTNVTMDEISDWDWVFMFSHIPFVYVPDEFGSFIELVFKHTAGTRWLMEDNEFVHIAPIPMKPPVMLTRLCHFGVRRISNAHPPHRARTDHTPRVFEIRKKPYDTTRSFISASFVSICSSFLLSQPVYWISAAKVNFLRGSSLTPLHRFDRCLHLEDRFS